MSSAAFSIPLGTNNGTFLSKSCFRCGLRTSRNLYSIPRRRWRSSQSSTLCIDSNISTAEKGSSSTSEFQSIPALRIRFADLPFSEGISSSATKNLIEEATGALSSGLACAVLHPTRGFSYSRTALDAGVRTQDEAPDAWLALNVPRWLMLRRPTWVRSVQTDSQRVVLLMTVARPMQGLHERLCQAVIDRAHSLREEKGVVSAIALKGEGAHDGMVALLTVHEQSENDDGEGAIFENDFAEKFVDDNGWKVRLFDVLYPPRDLWLEDDVRAFEDDGTAEVLASSSSNNTQKKNARLSSTVAPSQGANETARAISTPATEDVLDETSLARLRDVTGPVESPTRLLLGAGALDGIVIRFRELSGIHVGLLRVFTVCGWNAARAHPLNVELEDCMDNGRVQHALSLQVDAASASLNVLRKGLELLSDFRAHVIVGLGGGAVMDTAKALAFLAAQTPEHASRILDDIAAAAEHDARMHTVHAPAATMPAVFIPGTIGSGAELSGRAALVVELPNRRRRTILVRFEPKEIPRSPHTLACVDPRLTYPRRLNRVDAGQGALMIAACAIDSILCSCCTPQGQRWANEALKSATDNVLHALREPSHSDGPARDELAVANVAAAFARDASAHGVIAQITFALVDALVDGPLDGEFRGMTCRVCVSVLRVCERIPALEITLIGLAQIATGNAMSFPFSLSEWIRLRIEDVGIKQLREMGLSRKRAIAAAQQLAESGVTNVPHPIFENTKVLQEIVLDAMDGQPYEL